MADIKQLYSDAARTKPIYPKTAGSAVDLGGGKSLQDLPSVVVTLTAEGWSENAPYTQTVSVAGMTADWVPGVPTYIPSFNSDGSVDVSGTVLGLEKVAYIKILVSGNGTLTAICPEDKPPWSMTLRVPGTVGR